MSHLYKFYHNVNADFSLDTWLCLRHAREFLNVAPSPAVLTRSELSSILRFLCKIVAESYFSGPVLDSTADGARKAYDRNN